jgi:sortase A
MTVGMATADASPEVPGTIVDERPDRRARRARRGRRDRSRPLPPLTARQQVVRAAMVCLLAICASLLIELLLLSSLQHRAAQQQLFDSFREHLASGTAPTGPVDAAGRALASGSPIAYLEIPAIGLRQVVVEGTNSAATFDGPGHREDSPFPGQVGTTVVMGRSGAFGGPFGEISKLREGDVVRTTTAQGEFDYEVIGVRHEREAAPASLQGGEGRLMLVTADGRPFVPSGVLRVDAKLTSKPVGGVAPLYTPQTLSLTDRIMASDTSTVWALVLWLQALLAAVVGFVWAWHRWGRARAWVVFVPVLLVIALSVSDQAVRLLPNLL